MAHTFLIFDFGSNEDAAQQARHKLEGWKQAFRLGNKILMKFEREETAAADPSGDGDGKESSAKGKPAAKKKPAPKSKSEKSEPSGNIRVLVRLDFSDHEKLSHQRWLDRIPTEEPFKSAKSETVRHDAANFAATTDLFDSLD